MATLTAASAWPFPTGVKPNAAAPAAPTPRRRSRSWKPQITKLAEMLFAGASDAEIAKALDRTPKAITGQRGDAKAKSTDTGRKVAAEIERLKQVQAMLAKPKPINHNERWTDTADKALLLAYAQSKAPDQIAAICGRTVSSIAGRLHALGLLIFNTDEKTFMTAPQPWLKVGV